MKARKVKELARLNQKEPKPAMILRLLNEAQAGCKNDIDLGSALEFRREQYGLGVSDFAQLLGLTRSHYWEIVNAKRDITKNAMRRAFAIGIPAHALLQYPDLK
jgi:antitoxin component HigA of HigAB toxin-antitoxin module